VKSSHQLSAIRIGFVIVALAAGCGIVGSALTGCARAPQDAALRDVRPTKLVRGEKLLVEASGPYFTVGAPTTLTFNRILGVNQKPVTIAARAVSADRVVADADDKLAELLGQNHVVVASSVTVTQTVDGKTYSNSSNPNEPFAFDLYPRNLQNLAVGWADKASGGEIVEWLGMTAKPTEGGLKVVDVLRTFDRHSFLAKHDRPPLDGEISYKEALATVLTDEEFARLDTSHDGTIQHYELEEAEHKVALDSLAAQAGLQVGDVITKADGKAVASVRELEAAWQGEAGRKIPLAVTRMGEEKTLELPTVGKPDLLPGWLILALVLMGAAGLVALPVPLIAGLVVVWERKVSAYMQSRLGPNRVGPGGWLQWLADGLKLLMKEDIVPTDADPYLFKASPYLAFIGIFLTFLILPFSHYLIVSDLNIGLLFLLSVTSLVVVSIIMGGWSSNSKWSLLGGMRSAAQIISYELPASVALLTIATFVGSLSTQDIVHAQGGLPWNWFLFRSPFTFVAFFIWFISALAEGNRTPFDLPEAESELVSGYNTEYSGFRFSLFPMVEWVNLFVIGAIASMLFLGGWNIPMVTDMGMWESTWYWDLLGFAIFLVKDIAIIFVIIWIRWTLPRFRVDQMMNLCWKYFIPISFVNFIGVLLWAWLINAVHIVDLAMRWTMFGVFGVAFTLWFGSRVLYNRRKYSDLVLNDALGKVNA
jgi:NADH:ubiquinone oxidoreductase subunit H